MEIVADTNVFLAVALNEPEKDRIIGLTEGASILAPEIMPYEIGNALSAMVKRGKLTKPEAMSVEEAAERIPVRLVSVNIQESLQLALEHNLYAYDAYFLQCAQMTPGPLLSLDRRMKEVAAYLGIKLLE